MKELTKVYSLLLQDKRVKSEQTKYENFTRQRNIVLSKYKKVFQAFNDLIDGILRAQSFYSEMKDTVENLEKNVETFVNNRRSEGAQLLNQIERDKQHGSSIQADRERDRLRDLMERMSTDPSTNSSPTRLSMGRPSQMPRDSQPGDISEGKSPPMSPPIHSQVPLNYSNGVSEQSFDPSHQGFQHNLAAQTSTSHGSYQSGGGFRMETQYNPMMYPPPVVSPPPQQSYPQHPQYAPPPQQQHQSLPQGYVPPPPPPGPPPNQQGNYGYSNYPNPSGPGGYASHQPLRPGGTYTKQSQSDPWAGLNAWK